MNLTIDRWTELVQMTGDAIDWLDEHETLYDVWTLVAYAATSCALVQVRLTRVAITIFLQCVLTSKRLSSVVARCLHSIILGHVGKMQTPRRSCANYETA